MIRSLVRVAFAGVCLAAAALPAMAQQTTYPSRPVRIVVPYAPGGGTDIISRQLAAKLGEAWGQNVVVENRPGANGIVGTDLVLKSPPDGHNLVVWWARMSSTQACRKACRLTRWLTPPRSP